MTSTAFPPLLLFSVAFQVMFAVPEPTAKSSPVALLILLPLVAENVPLTPLPRPIATPLSGLLVLETMAFCRSRFSPLTLTDAPPVAAMVAPEFAVSPAVAELAGVVGVAAGGGRRGAG